MNILRHLYLSTAMRAPDDGGAAAPDPVAVVAEVPAAAEVAPDPAATEVVPEATPAVRAPTMVPLRILQERVGEETTKRQQFELRATQAEQRAADLQAILDRMQAERPDPANPTPAPRAPAAAAPAAAPRQGTAEFNAAVKAEAQQQHFYDETLAVKAAGEAKFKDFGDTLAVLTAIGATNDDFLSDLFAVDKTGAHEILDKLAKDPERAASLVRMDTRRRIAELTRMSDAIKPVAADPAAAAAIVAAKPAAAAPAQSRAPAPKPVIVPQAAAHEVDPTTPDGNEKLSDEDFEKWYKGKYYKRA
jgi:hypothetical protein